MNNINYPFRVWLSFILVILFSSFLYSQEWLMNRRFGEGRGVKISPGLVLHPGISIEGGYDSNIFADRDEVYSVAKLRLTPHLDLATLPPQRREGLSLRGSPPPTTNFRFGLATIYHEYFHEYPQIRKYRDIGVQSSLSLEVFPQKVWTFSLLNQFIRTTDPPNSAFAEPFTRDYNQLELGLQYAPGGRMLIGRSFFRFGINYFEEGRYQNKGNYFIYGVGGNLNWKIFPKTAVLCKVLFTPHDYITDWNKDSYPLRSWVGLRGLLTSRLITELLLGYGVSFYIRGPQYDNVIGKVSLKFLITPFTNIKVGYERDFRDSFFANFYTYDLVFLENTYLIGGRVLLGLRGEYQRLGFAPLEEEELIARTNQNPRIDHRAALKANAEYRIRDWLGIILSFIYVGNFTDFVWTFDYPTGGTGKDYGEYQRWEFYSGIKAFY
jgi:hypothetical protein